MSSMSKTIIFFGNERIATGVSTATPILHALIENGYTIAAIVANYERGVSRDTRDLEVAEVAKKYHIPVLLPDKLSTIAQQLKDFQATAGVLVAYGKIVPKSIIDIFPRGIINIHPSLLPKHRGPTPLESVILDGSSVTGVSVMQLVKAMDAGPIYAQSETTLTGQETKQELADSLLEISRAMLIEVLPGILSEEVVARPQNDAEATYDKLIAKEDGRLDWSKPAEQLEREIRAYLEWPKSKTTLGSLSVVVTAAHVEAGSGTPGALWQQPKKMGVYTTHDILAIDKLKPAGKQEMSIKAFLAGYGNKIQL